MRFLFAPQPVKDAQIPRHVEQCPLSAHIIGSSYRPASKSVVLFDVSEVAFNDPTPFPQHLVRFWIGQALSHLLHGCSVLPDFDYSAAFRVLTQFSDRAIFHVAAISFYRLAFLLKFSGIV